MKNVTKNFKEKFLINRYMTYLYKHFQSFSSSSLYLRLIYKLLLENSSELNSFLRKLGFIHYIIIVYCLYMGRVNKRGHFRMIRHYFQANKPIVFRE